ncbi:MAG: hypothetical protein R3D34_18010 [Nitratireductor sp.]
MPTSAEKNCFKPLQYDISETRRHQFGFLRNTLETLISHGCFSCCSTIQPLIDLEEHLMSNALPTRKTILCLASVLVVMLAQAHHASAADTDREKGAANFQLADANADNALNKSEFVTFIDLNAASNLGRAGMIQKNKRYDMAFSRLDVNGDGVVTPDELAGLGL